MLHASQELRTEKQNSIACGFFPSQLIVCENIVRTVRMIQNKKNADMENK